MKKEHYYPPPSSASTTSGWTAGRRRFADWLPWKLFQDQMNPDKANHGWFIGRYARECLHILPKLPATLKWPVAPTSVLEWHQVDESLREPGIYYGYRPEVSSWTECCHSLFTANNETLNFWTHFFPTVFFIWRTVQLADQWNIKSDGLSSDYAQPFLIYMFSAILYPLMSAIAHGFSALSHRARAVLFFMDYAAINFYAYGSGLLYRAYVLPDSWMQMDANIYLGMCVFLSLASTTLTCTSRAIVRDVVAQRLMRLAAFTLPYIWVSIPLFVRLFDCFRYVEASSSCPTADALRATKLHLCQVIVALLASFCYASHLPERILPGKFDYVGHSHNLLHICGVTATLFQMEGALIDMDVRRSHLIENQLAMMDPFWDQWIPLVVLLGHVLLVAVFGLYIYWNEPQTIPTCNQNKKCH
ncbi:hypothetical protein OUZ56_014189 [Daphnia magna]|uniref:Membrane progestin receptor gamma n=1 Tax=Daphnia magna TaxID=35525 RepID=A0ABQ9Z831_9CRUS|nr:hypothetical protein OUZ56_014189 [Daphnia magna]